MDPAVGVFWFGRQLFLSTTEQLHPVELPERGDEVAAVVEAIVGLEPKPKAVRLIFQPSDIEVHAVDCVRANRSVVRSTLCEDHPALRHATASWAVSRLVSTEVGFATLLWIDPKQRLQKLRTALAARHVRLVGAWPIVSLLENTAPVNESGGAALAVIVTDSGGLVYAATPGGARTAVWVMGGEHRGQLGGLLRNALARFTPAHPPAVLVVDASSERWNLGVGPLADLNPTVLALEQLLSGLSELLPRDLANFLPPEPRVTPRAAVLGFAAVCVAVALANAGLYARDYRRFQNDETVRKKLAAELRTTNSRLTENKGTIDNLRALELEMNVAGAGRMKLVTEVMRNRPPEITLHSITVSGTTFQITGTAHEGVGQSSGPFYRFIDALAGGSAPWQIAPESRPAVLAAAQFSVRGTLP